MTDARLDWDRAERTGVAEAVLCDGKATRQIADIVDIARAEGRRLLLTRLSPERAAELGPLDYDPLSRTAILGPAVDLRDHAVGVVCAGTSDISVAREALRTLEFHGVGAALIADVGVAGLWRLLDALPQIERFRIIIAVAGMEGALFSVLSGLVSAPVIAVPTSVGYGVAEGGRAALTTALASCAPGIVVVNIDNGFGAAAAALKWLGTGPPSASSTADC